MKILTFDTTLDKTYICLSENGKIIAKKTLISADDKYHSAFLIQEIANILKVNNFEMKDIDAIGIDIGPGSFTGIRACTTIGRVIAQQLDLPLISCSSMELLSKISQNNKVAVVLDARKRSAYVAVYENGREKIMPHVVPLTDVKSFLDKEDCTVITDTAMSEFLNEQGIKSVNYEDDNYPLDEYLMCVTEEKVNSNKNKNLKEEFNWANVKPLYIQPPSIFGK